MMKKYVLLLLLSSFFCTGSFAGQEELTTTDYGTLYMLEKRDSQVPPWQMGVAYGYEFSNPYLNVSGLTAGATRNLSRFFGVGVQFERYFATENNLTSSVQNSLKTDQITQTVQKPAYSVFATVSMTPLAGRLNLFSYSTLPFDFLINLGGGATSYQSQSLRASVLWAIAPQIMFSSRLGMNLSIGQEIESPLTNSSLAKFEGKIGTFVRF